MDLKLMQDNLGLTSDAPANVLLHILRHVICTSLGLPEDIQGR
jgi:hypothetical protein